MRAAVIDCSTGKYEDASSPSAVQAAKGATSYRHLAVGTEGFLKKVNREMLQLRLALVAAFTNPYTHALKIRFTLPFAGVTAVRFTMIDLMGRTVWDKAVACGHASGVQEYVWQGGAAGRRPVVPGIYILRMTATDGRGNTAGAFKRKVSYLP